MPAPLREQAIPSPFAALWHRLLLRWGRAALSIHINSVRLTVSPPKILTIAGSDSGGGAGIQADLKTIAAHRCYGLSVLVALTAQNTLGVQDVMDVPPEFVTSQLDAVLQDIGCDAAKTGMLSRPETIRAVAAAVRKYDLRNLVVDPVMVSKSGHRLLQPEAIEALVSELIPLATLITPNLEEVAELMGRRPENEREMEEAARELGRLGPAAVLVKGGHLGGTTSIDILWDGNGLHRLEAPRIDARHTHGTGCTLSAAIASNLGSGKPLATAVQKGKEFLTRSLETAYQIGCGIGPVNHLWEFETKGEELDP